MWFYKIAFQMIRDETFDERNSIKKHINGEEKKTYLKEWDVWWSSLWINIGSESYGKGSCFRRPVLVLKKLSSNLFVWIPLTTIDKKRLQRKIWELKKSDFKNIKKRLKTLLNLS